MTLVGLPSLDLALQSFVENKEEVWQVYRTQAGREVLARGGCIVQVIVLRDIVEEMWARVPYVDRGRRSRSPTRIQGFSTRA